MASRVGFASAAVWSRLASGPLLSTNAPVQETTDITHRQREPRRLDQVRIVAAPRRGIVG